MLTGLDTLIAEVTDMPRANAFYRDVLGLVPEYESPHWSSYKIGDGRLGLHPPFERSKGGGGGWVIGVATADIVALRAHLTASGIKVGEFHQTPGGVVMDFDDPDGNRLQAMQRGFKIEQISE